MRMYLISDNEDTQVGMRLAGVDGTMVSGKEELEQILDEVVKDKEIGILLITEKLCRLAPGKVDEIKLYRRTPLIVEIPDREGTGRRSDFISAYVRDAIGIKI